VDVCGNDIGLRGMGRKPGLVDSKLDSRLEGRGFKSCLILRTLDGNGVKAMPGRVKYPILVYSIQYLKKERKYR